MSVIIFPYQSIVSVPPKSGCVIRISQNLCIYLHNFKKAVTLRKNKEMSHFNMMKKRYIILILLSCFFHALVPAQQKTARVDKSLTIFSDVLRQLDMNYADTLNYEQLTETAINAMLRKLDPYTVYLPKKKDDDLRMMTQGKYGGIVAQLIHVLSGHTAKEIVDADLYFIDRISLREHLSPTRSNGLVAMLKQMRDYALAFQALGQ